MAPLKEINLSDARALAALEARAFPGTHEPDVLSPEYAEAGGCWIFFRNRNLAFPPHMSLASSAAHAVSRRAEVRAVADCSGSPVEMDSLSSNLSSFFLQDAKHQPT
jgi:hypothetical protein